MNCCLENEYLYLVHLVRCALKGENPQELPQGLSFKKVYEFGKAHEVANIAYLSIEKLNNKPTQDLLLSWKNFYYISIQRDIEQQNVKNQIISLLHENSIRTLEVQGTIIKDFYPSSDLRMMSDLDFIVDKSNLQKAKELVLNLGFVTEEENEEEWGGKNSRGIKVEIHTDFFYSVRTFQNGIKCLSAMGNAFSHASSSDGLNFRLDNTKLYLFNLLHTLKHFLSTGAGIRRILDLYVLKNTLKDIDYEYIDQVLTKNRIYSIGHKLISLADYWFEDLKGEESFLVLQDYVFISDNHGGRKFLVKKNLVRSKKKNKKFVKIRYVFSRIFISKQRCYALYPFCKKHKYPTFMCHLHRIMVLIFCKRKKGLKQELKNIKDTKI